MDCDSLEEVGVLREVVGHAPDVLGEDCGGCLEGFPRIEELSALSHSMRLRREGNCE